MEARFYSYAENFEHSYYTDKDISCVTEKGIILKNGETVEFEACVRNFVEAHGDIHKNCVGERISPVFIFYTSPKPTVINFRRNCRLCEFFSPAINRSFSFQMKINEVGFRTLDMS